MPLLRCLTSLFILGFLSSCGAKGPIVTDCVSNPRAQNFLCVNQGNNRKLIQSPAQVDNWVFFSAADVNLFLNSCVNRLGGVKVNPCIFSSVSLSYACINSTTGQGFGMKFEDSENWIGFSSVDLNLLLDYCASNKK